MAASEGQEITHFSELLATIADLEVQLEQCKQAFLNVIDAAGGSVVVTEKIMADPPNHLILMPRPGGGGIQYIARRVDHDDTDA